MPHYNLVYWTDGEWLVGRLRERSEVFSQGRTLQELEDNIKEALALMEEMDFISGPQAPAWERNFFPSSAWGHLDITMALARNNLPLYN